MHHAEEIKNAFKTVSIKDCGLVAVSKLQQSIFLQQPFKQKRPYIVHNVVSEIT